MHGPAAGLIKPRVGAGRYVHVQRNVIDDRLARRHAISGGFVGEQAVRRLFDQYYAVLNAHDLGGIADVLTEDAVFDDDFVPGVVFHSAAEVRDVFDVMWHAFPDLEFAIRNGPFFAADSHQCMVYGRITGTLANAVPDFGLVKVGASIDQEYMALYEASGDRFSRVRVCLNRSVTAGQVG